jgi:hypothetical protein
VKAPPTTGGKRKAKLADLDLEVDDDEDGDEFPVKKLKLELVHFLFRFLFRCYILYQYLIVHTDVKLLTRAMLMTRNLPPRNTMTRSKPITLPTLLSPLITDKQGR